MDYAELEEDFIHWFNQVKDRPDCLVVLVNRFGMDALTMESNMRYAGVPF